MVDVRYFTVSEAEQFIPELENIFRSIYDLRAKAEAKAEILRELKKTKPAALSEWAVANGQLEFLVSQMNEWFQKIIDKGALPKGLDPALVDFPYRLNNQEVYLCWKLGENAIAHYHGLEEGVAGRKRLPTTIIKPLF